MKQSQIGGDQSRNIQAGSITIQGVSYSDARQIAIDVMKSELSVLTTAAETEAAERLSRYADKLIERLRTRPELLERFREPRTQYSVRDAHLLHAKRGADDIVDLSIDILVDYIATRGDDFKAVVLNDAIKTIHSLTSAQIDSLTLLLLLRHFAIDAADLSGWCESMSSLAAPFVETATRSNAQLDYLVGIGCADFEVLNQTFAHLFNARYVDLSVSLFRQTNPDARHHDEVIQWSPSKVTHAKRKAGADDLAKMFADHSPQLQALQSYFDNSKLARMNLRIVGKAIGTANLRHKQPALQVTDALWLEQ